MKESRRKEEEVGQRQCPQTPGGVRIMVAGKQVPLADLNLSKGLIPR